MDSKVKGKPPGFVVHGVEISTESALYETTEVLETLHAGSMAIGMEAEEGEGTLDSDSNFGSIPVEVQPARVIGELAAKFAQTSETEYVVMDNKTSEDVILPCSYLQDEEFAIGLWYARQLQIARGLNPEDILMTDRYVTELGDPYLGAAALLLENHVWDGDVTQMNFDRILFEDLDSDSYIVKDRLLEREHALRKSYLKDQQFDLIGWYESTFGTNDSEYDMVSAPDYGSEYDMLSTLDDESELTLSEDESIPELQPGSEPDSDLDNLRIRYPGHVGETVEDRMASVARRLEAAGIHMSPPEVKKRRHALGDVLGKLAHAISIGSNVSYQSISVY
ncbi:hypothetical protein B0H13DRAFT_2315993 [Mycena leptocephala]|nr:hypothetical protein B0H13DRAFT_2315993 [Mycena leptocephala]